MQFHLSTAEIFVPDGLPAEQALRRTTRLAISAHQDDIEIMAAAPILQCFQNEDLWFSGVVMTNGEAAHRVMTCIKITLMMPCTRCASRSKRKLPSSVKLWGSGTAGLPQQNQSKMDRIGNPSKDIARVLEGCRPQFIFSPQSCRQT